MKLLLGRLIEKYSLIPILFTLYRVSRLYFCPNYKIRSYTRIFLSNSTNLNLHTSKKRFLTCFEPSYHRLCTLKCINLDKKLSYFLRCFELGLISLNSLNISCWMHSCIEILCSVLLSNIFMNKSMSFSAVYSSISKQLTLSLIISRLLD